MSSVRKTSPAELEDGRECILSNSRVDAYDDVCEAFPESWDLSDFRGNPICLLNHCSDAPIGSWKHVAVRDGALRGRLHLAPAGTSPRIDEVRKLVEHKILRGISVGFVPLESRPRPNSKKGGMIYTKMKLLEASLVSVPANSDALLLQCRSLGISTELQKTLFPEMTIGQRIRKARRAVRKARGLLEQANTPAKREVMSRVVAQFEHWERELRVGTWNPAQRQAIRDKALALVARLEREERAADPHGVKRQQKETIDGFERTAAQLEARARPRDDGPHYSNSDEGAVIWRGQKIPGLSWRGKKV